MIPPSQGSAVDQPGVDHTALIVWQFSDDEDVASITDEW
jgi:hypothetical protein